MSNGSTPRAVVVLVHGLYMHGLCMGLLRRRLERAGHRVVAFSYPSLRTSLEKNADHLAAWLATLESERVDFVAHSLGGLMIRHLFHRRPPQRPGRVVTLGTPHQSSFVAREIESRGLGVMLGRARVHGLLGAVPPWDSRVELGSIAGGLGFGLGRLFPALPAPNDGTVSVRETVLEGMVDHLVMPVTHTGLILSKPVAQGCDEFLRHGRFGSSGSVAPPGPSP